MPAIFTNWAALTHRAIVRRIILSENSPPGAYLGSSIAVAAIGMEKSREERIKLLLKMECLQVYLSKTYNPSLNY